MYLNTSRMTQYRFVCVLCKVCICVCACYVYVCACYVGERHCGLPGAEGGSSRQKNGLDEKPVQRDAASRQQKPSLGVQCEKNNLPLPGRNRYDIHESLAESGKCVRVRALHVSAMHVRVRMRACAVLQSWYHSVHNIRNAAESLS